MTVHISRSPEETFELGERLARTSRAGMVFGLIGELGAGKTQFVRGFARGLGITERVHSPTFALVNEYRSGRLACHHLDLYRLETREQILGAGLETYFEPREGITLIEWFDRAYPVGAAPGNVCVVTFEVKSETVRAISYEDTRP